MWGEAKHVAGINDRGACHGHVGGHVLQGGAGAAGPPVVCHGVGGEEVPALLGEVKRLYHSTLSSL